MATFIMALGISTTIIAMQTGFKSLDVARDTTLASQIIQSEVERIRLMNWGDITALDEKEVVDISKMFTSSAKITDRFTVVRTKEDLTGYDGEMKQITVYVTWKGYDGRSHQMSMSTYYAKNGLYDFFYTMARP